MMIINYLHNIGVFFLSGMNANRLYKHYVRVLTILIEPSSIF